MKHITVLALAGGLLLGTFGESRAQEWYGIATWNISFPTGDTKEFVDETSFRGFGLEFRKAVATATTLGIMSGWDVFHERTEEVVEFEGGAVSGSQDRYINSFPIMLGLHRYLGDRDGARPYLGLGAGGFVLIQTLRVGVAEVEDDTWEWGLAPEAGLIIPTSYGSAFTASARYYWSPTIESLSGRDIDLTYWAIHVGFVWEQR